ncbi:MAG TPA: archaemetzincin family Zn-dependent metalloprotease [Blastocatellia bacterium]|jgi:archaemetzincin
MTTIQLVPVGNIERDVVDYLAMALPERLGLACATAERVLDPRDAYDPARKQYNSTRILSQLLKVGEGGKLLGVASVDLFIPILTFVFGEAQLGARAALMSVFRLHQRFYGLPEDERLFYERCEKEALHELGHTFGLVHCKLYECVMHYSNSIEQVDLKHSRFCPSCSALMTEGKHIC